MHTLVKTVGLIVILLITIAGIVMWNWLRPVVGFNQSKIPRDLITAQFIDFDRIYMISKFRSGAGHDYSHEAYNGESCRSMKHYFNTSKNQINGRPLRSQATDNEPNIKIYAPFDGKITSASAEHIGTQIHISSDKYPYYIRIFHMDLLSEFKEGTHVKSGQWIGTIGPKDGTDFAVEANTFRGIVYLSMFEVMTDQVFEPYAKRGFKREDFIISRQYRDAHPCTCGGVQTNSLNKASETFQHPKDRSWTEDFVYLKEDPYPIQEQSQPTHIGPPR